MSPIDLVKKLKPSYSPSAKAPVIVEVPELAFLMLDGRGDPNSAEEYQAALQALYGVAYTLKFTLKKATPERDFKVAPLEGLWWTGGAPPSLDALQDERDAWNWTMMIAVPDDVTAAEVAAFPVIGRRFFCAFLIKAQYTAEPLNEFRPLFQVCRPFPKASAENFKRSEG